METGFDPLVVCLLGIRHVSNSAFFDPSDFENWLPYFLSKLRKTLTQRLKVTFQKILILIKVTPKIQNLVQQNIKTSPATWLKVLEMWVTTGTRTIPEPTLNLSFEFGCLWLRKII